MIRPQRPNAFPLPAWVAAFAFAAVIGCYFLVFFTVRLGEREPATIPGMDLVLGVEDPTAPTVHTPVEEADPAAEDPAADEGSAGEVNPAEKARRFLENKQQARPDTPVPINIAQPPTPEKVRAPMAIAVLALAVLGLIASLIGQRAARFAAAACAIVGLICAGLLLTGAKDLPLAQATGGTVVMTGAIEVLPGIGFWGAIGSLALATLLAALGLAPPTSASVYARKMATQTKPTAISEKPAMRTYSSSEKTEKNPPPAPPPAAVTSAAQLPSAPEMPIAIVGPEEPPNGPDVPPPTSPPSSGRWSFKRTEPTQAPPPPRDPPAPPSSWYDTRR